jgi:hypothetical protein
MVVHNRARAAAPALAGGASVANYESPRTTKLYDHTSNAISLDEVERIVI